MIEELERGRAVFVWYDLDHLLAIYEHFCVFLCRLSNISS